MERSVRGKGSDGGRGERVPEGIPDAPVAAEPAREKQGERDRRERDEKRIRQRDHENSGSGDIGNAEQGLKHIAGKIRPAYPRNAGKRRGGGGESA